MGYKGDQINPRISMAKGRTKDEQEKVSVTNWKRRYQIALDNQRPWFKKAAEWYDLLYANIKDDDFAWHSRIFEPLLSSKTWNIIAKTISGQPGWMCNVIGEKTDDLSDRAMAMEEALKYFHDHPEIDPSMFERYAVSLLDAIVTGIGWQSPCWEIKSKEVRERNIDNYGNIDTTSIKVKKTNISYPDSINRSIFDVFLATTRTNSVQKLPWVIIRSYEPLSDLKQRNEDEGGYINLDKIHNRSISDTESYERSRNRLMNQDEKGDETVDEVEKWECYEKVGNKIFVTVIANGKEIIKPKQIFSYWHCKYPLVAFKIKPKAFSIIGEGIFESNERLVWGINDIDNHFLDAWNLANNPMIMQEEGTVVDTYEIAPGNQFLYKGQVEPKPFMFPQPSVQAFQGVREAFLGSVEQNSLSGFQMGTPMDATDNTGGTAAGTKAIQQAGDDLLDFFRKNFRKGVREVGLMWMQMIQQFLDKSIWVQIVGENGAENVEITPEMIQGEFNLDIEETSMQPQNKEFELNKYTAFVDKIIEIAEKSKETPQPVFPEYNQLIKDLAQKFQYKDADKYLMSQEQVQEMMMAQQPQMPQLPPEEQMNMPELPPEENMEMPPLPPQEEMELPPLPPQ